MIRSFGKILFAFFCFLGIIGFLKATASYLGHISINNPQTVVPFFVGCLFYIVLWIFVFSRRERFWSILEHELTHLIFATIFFKRVHSFYASREGDGRVEVEGDNFMIALSPYFFPLLTVVVLLIKPSVHPDFQFIPNGLLGFTIMFHLVYLLKEFHPAQPDLKKNGMLFSVLVVGFFNIFFLGLCIASLEGNWQDLGAYIVSGISECQYLVEQTGRIMYEEAFAKMAK